MTKTETSENMQPEKRKKYATMASVTGIVVNLLLFGGKLCVGLITKSIAIIADAFNNVFDATSSLVAFIGFKMSTKHADKGHPLGHGRLEYISAFIVSMIIIFVGAELLKSSIEGVITPEMPAVDLLTFIILGTSIAVKFGLFFFYRIVAKKIDSSVLRAASLDSISDVVATTVVLVSALVAKFAGYNIDGWAGIAVAAFIIFTGLRSAKETVDLLVGSPPDKKFIDSIYDFAKSYPDVVGIHDVMVHDYGVGRKIISFHAEVPSTLDFSYAHDVVDCIERDMQQKFGCLVTIHLDPIVLNDGKIDELKLLAEQCAKEINPAFSIHDFRMTYGGKHFNVIFDLLVPADCDMPCAEAAEKVGALIKSKNPDCYPVIKAEYPFV